MCSKQCVGFRVTNTGQTSEEWRNKKGRKMWSVSGRTTKKQNEKHTEDMKEGKMWNHKKHFFFFNFRRKHEWRLQLWEYSMHSQVLSSKCYSTLVSILDYSKCRRSMMLGVVWLVSRALLIAMQILTCSVWLQHVARWLLWCSDWLLTGPSKRSQKMEHRTVFIIYLFIFV